MARFSNLAVLVSLLTTGFAGFIPSVSDHNDSLSDASQSSTDVIADHYIVILKDHVDVDGTEAHYNWVQNIHDLADSGRAISTDQQLLASDNDYKGLVHTYKIGDSLKGYSGHFRKNLIEQIRDHPDVEHVESDQRVRLLESPLVEENAPWGLARVSHRETPVKGDQQKYLFSAKGGGEGVDVYVIDTGVNTQHVDFEGRAAWAITIAKGVADVDDHGHGTHVSGTIIGKKYGVAKKAHVKAVRVCDANGGGRTSDVIKGVEYVYHAHLKQTQHAENGQRKNFKGSVINMSLGVDRSAILDMAVNAAVDAGVHVAVAASNDYGDACLYSPAAAANPITVGASTISDERASFSNYGKCVDIFAPGFRIESAWIGSDHASEVGSGTSMATPHVAGLLAYFLSLQPPKGSAFAVAELTPKKLKKKLLSIGTRDVLSGIPDDTVNLLAWNGGGEANLTAIFEQTD